MAIIEQCGDRTGRPPAGCEPTEAEHRAGDTYLSRHDAMQGDHVERVE